MEVYSYKDYNEYMSEQVKANVRKLAFQYVDPVSMGYVIDHLVNVMKLKPKEALCHGTRRGIEQQIIIQALKGHDIECNVTGTEISPTASDYPNTIQWDFHDVKEEWLGNIDLIYSNSFDHTYKPEECLDAWMSCLSESGVCILEYSEVCDNQCSVTDPFSATMQEYIDMIEKKYRVVEVLNNNGMNDEGLTHKGLREFILIKNAKE